MNTSYLPCTTLLFPILFAALIATTTVTAEDYEEDKIEIVEGGGQTVYEFRQNGVLTMIKIVPKNGRAYYMVPADGAPHYESLDHKRQLYPQWVIKEW